MYKLNAFDLLTDPLCIKKGVRNLQLRFIFSWHSAHYFLW